MNEDWEKKYWERRAAQIQNQRPRQTGQNNELPHYEPLHVIQNKQRAQYDTSGEWADINPTTAMYMNVDGMKSRNSGPGSQMVMLREGSVVYRAIQANGFGTTMPMVRNCGPASGIVGREFNLKGETSCYLIDNMEVVDLGDINQQKMLHLVEVSAPFIGTLLVEKSSIINISANNTPQILKG